MSIKLYYDLMSQPSRTLYILLKTINCNFEPKLVDLRKAEHHSDWFTKVNRIQRVPVIDYNGFVLSESVAIVKFLVRENLIPESLYPLETKTQARVEEFLEWHHVGLRLHCAMYFRVKYMDPILIGRKTDDRLLAAYEGRMVRGLDDFNDRWLGRGNQFIVGDSITVADLFAATEIEQPKMADYDPHVRYPRIGEWAAKVREYFNPHYDEAHVILNKIIKKQQNAKL